MESKINIKELAKNLKNLNRGEFSQTPPAEAIIEPNKGIKEVITPKPIQKENVEKSKPVTQKRATIVSDITQTSQLMTTLQSAIEDYDFTKQVWIDEEIYEILMNIKRREKIKSISVLVTSIVEQYINQNRTAIVRLLNDKPKKI